MRLHACFALIALSLFSGAAEARDRALLVGVGDYADPRAAADLEGPAYDVPAMRDLLVGRFGYAPEEILVLQDADATRGGIFNAFRDWLIAGTEPGDRVFFYFSGHGSKAQITDASGETRLTSTLMPHDAVSGVPYHHEGPGGHVLGAHISAFLDELSDRDVTIMVDACHSGSVSRGEMDLAGDAVMRTITPYGPANFTDTPMTEAVRSLSKTTARLVEPVDRSGQARANVAVWQAVTLDQLSFETYVEEGTYGGVFTHAFVRGLTGPDADHDRDGRVTASHLLSYVRDYTAAFCETTPNCVAGFTPDLVAMPEYRARFLVPDQPAQIVVQPEPAPEPSVEQPEAPAAMPEIGEVTLVELASGVLSHTNDFEVRAEILPGSDVKLGEAVRFRISSAEEGEVVVLDSGADGQLRLIYPNEYSATAGRQGRISALSPLTIPDESYPFEFTATDPGAGTLVVLVGEPGTDFSALLQGEDFRPVEGAERALVAVAAELQQPVLSPALDVPNRARRWAFTTVNYLVSQ